MGRGGSRQRLLEDRAPSTFADSMMEGRHQQGQLPKSKKHAEGVIKGDVLPILKKFSLRERNTKGRRPNLDEDAHFIGEVQDETPSSADPGWHIKLKIGSQDSTWCIGHYAQVSAMPVNIFNPVFGQLRLTDRNLLDRDYQPLDVIG